MREQEARIRNLEKQAEKMKDRLFDKDGNLKVSHGSKDLKSYNRIQQYLDKLKAIADRDKKKKEQEEKEKARAVKQDQAYDAIKAIKDKIDQLGT